MTPARAAWLALGAAFLVFAGFEGAARLRPAAAGSDPEALAAELRRGFLARLREAEASARCALEDGPAEARSRCVSEGWRGRLEGLAVGRAPDEWLDWTGTPGGTLPAGPPAGPAWEIRSAGMRHTLVARSAPDSDGRFGAAWFTLDASPNSDPAALRLPARLLGAGRGTVTLLRARPSEEGIPLDAPDGTRLASVRVDPVPPSVRSERLRARGRALAGLIAAFGLLAAAAGRRASPMRVVGCLVGARTALALGWSLENLLPRSWGGPSLYGSVAGWGILDSPAAFAATAAAWLGIALALRSTVMEGPGRTGSRIALGVAAASSVGALVFVATSLARDGRADVLSLAGATTSLAQSLLLAGIAAASLATALLLQGVWIAWAGAARAGLVLAGALAVSAAVAAEAHLHARDRLSGERLEAEFAPLVADPSARRRLALESHVAEAARSTEVAALVTGDARQTDPSAGWLLWSRGPLGLRGWLSSIDVVAPDGSVRAHFAFGLPPLQEPFPTEDVGADEGLSVRAEVIAFGASDQRLLHAEAAIPSDSPRRGRVVAHVLDEPDNLPFLPGAAPYLLALGSPAPPVEGPEYVLYEADGRIALSTLARPPAPDPDWIPGHGTSRLLPIRSGGSDFLALAIRSGGRTHLLLSPRAGALERAGGVARIALLQGILLGLWAGGVSALVHLAPRRLPHRSRGSFYRKLLAAMLAASLLPLLGLAVVLRASIAQGAERSLQESAADVVGAVRRVVEDYAAVLRDDGDAPPPRVDDGVLSWLRTTVGQEIHLYENDLVAATSKPELFASGLLSSRLPGEVRRALVERGEPSVVREEPLGGTSLPVAYARADLAGSPAVLAVPLVLQQRAISVAMERVIESLFLATLLLGTLLALASAWMAGAVSRPVREMVDAAARIARGDYAARLRSGGDDELARLADGFNVMAAALFAQRADLERRRDYIEALLRHATTGVVSTDASGRIVTMNPAAARLLEASGARAAPGERLEERARAVPSLGALSDLLDRPLSDRVEPEEIDVRIPDSPRRLRVVRVPLPDASAGPPGALLLLDDVTEIARSNQLAAWAEMARAIAHEIKNPLTPIQLSTEHMERILRDRGALPDADLEACIRAVLTQVRTLREIAAEFSAYAKIPALAPVATDVPSFLREALAPYRAALPRGVRLEERYHPVPECAVDRRAMARAVTNLVENSLHAMPGGGTLRLSATHDADAGEVTIAVEDTGSGLTPEAAERLFEPYFSTKSAGTGLGLAIVLRTVEAHGGRVDVKSRPGSGATFRIRLPAIR